MAEIGEQKTSSSDDSSVETDNSSVADVNAKVINFERKQLFVTGVVFLIQAGKCEEILKSNDLKSEETVETNSEEYHTVSSGATVTDPVIISQIVRASETISFFSVCVLQNDSIKFA